MAKKDTGENKAKKPIFKRWWFWLIILVVLYSAFGSGGSGTKKNNETADAVEAPQESQEDTQEQADIENAEENAGEEAEDKTTAGNESSNPLMNCEVREADVKSGSGEVIGKRAYVEISSAEAAKLTNEQIAEFMLNVVDGADYNYFTVDFGTGKGIVIPGCTIEGASFIGDIDETGGIEKTDQYLYVSRDGSVTFEDAEEESGDALEENESSNEEKLTGDDNVSTEFKNALRKAEQYSTIMHMSKQGIYDQLTSEYGERFPEDAAQYAIDNMMADWNANALAKAKDYSDTMHMSKQGVYDQLVSEYGEKFLAEEAQYAVDNVEADWNANALAKAKDYQNTMGMSSSAIYEQLTSEFGEKFTAEEAQFAIDNLE